jgi:hypothetical protein
MPHLHIIAKQPPLRLALVCTHAPAAVYKGAGAPQLAQARLESLK